jgi:hypothetical protein
MLQRIAALKAQLRPGPRLAAGTDSKLASGRLEAVSAGCTGINRINPVARLAVPAPPLGLSRPVVGPLFLRLGIFCLDPGAEKQSLPRQQ